MTKRTHCNEPFTQAEMDFTRAAGALAMAELDWFLGDATDQQVEEARKGYLAAHDTLNA
jgi:hypothetical protein